MEDPGDWTSRTRSNKSETESQNKADNKIHAHLDHQKVKAELQDLLGNMYREDVSTIEILRNNAKAFGGMVGAEHGYWEAKSEEEDNSFFFKRPTLNLQDLTFSEIESTKLGLAIKNQIRKLEERIEKLQGSAVDMRNAWKAREGLIWKTAEEEIDKRYRDKYAASQNKFKSEVDGLKL